MARAGVLPPDTRARRAAARDTEGGRSMRPRTVLLTTSLLRRGRAAWREAGAPGRGGGGGESAAAGASASGGREDCAPVPGEQLVVLEDDKQLQSGDSLIPAVRA